ncbi:hypothetical protein EUX98_g9326, partial [Antrodiella citrinella]
MIVHISEDTKAHRGMISFDDADVQISKIHKQALFPTFITIQKSLPPSQPFMSEKCTKCNGTFQTRGQRDSHTRNCGYVVQIPVNGTLTPLYKENDLFYCRCSHGTCTSRYTDIKYLLIHLAKEDIVDWLAYTSGEVIQYEATEAAAKEAAKKKNAEKHPIDEPVDSAPQLLASRSESPPTDTAELTSVLASDTPISYSDAVNIFTLSGFTVNSYHTLTCTFCCMAYGLPAALVHSRKHHPDVSIDNALFANAATACNIHDTLPSTPLLAEGYPVFPDLKLHAGLVCLGCAQCSIAEKFMSQHVATHSPPALYEQCVVQHFNQSPGESRTWFKVLVPDTPVDTEGDAYSVEQELARLTKIIAVNQHKVIDARDRSPWLLSCKWDQFTADLVPSEAKQWIAFPKGAQWKYFSDTVQEYFEDAIQLIAQTDELALQRLNTDYPMRKGISNTPFHKHQNETTLKEYVNPILCLLAGVLKDTGTKAFALPSSEAKDALAEHAFTNGSTGPLKKAIHNFLLEIWTTTWKPSPTNLFPCPTIRLLILLSLHHDRSHDEPKHVTPRIAKLKYLMRLVFLQELRSRSDDLDGQDDLACDTLEKYFTEKKPFPFNSICSLTHRASDIAMNETAMPEIWWTDRTNWSKMLFKGEEISLDSIRNMFPVGEQQMVDLWENTLLFGLPLSVPYGNLKEDLSCYDVNYSFLSDPRNTMLHQDEQLVRELQRSSQGKQWIKVENSKTKWNIPALRRWLKNYAQFNLLLLMRCEMLSGGPGRGTELTGMVFRTTPTRKIRNLCVLGTHVAMIRTYSKTSAITRMDKVIPHSLDAFTANMMVQNLALVRPFALRAAAICYPGQPEILQIYQQNLFVNDTKLFTSNNLSAIMASHTTQALGVKLTISSWRHISVTWRRKINAPAMELYEGVEEESVEARQLGHSTEVEKKHYGITPDALAGVSEDVLPLFLDASGLPLTYQQARSSQFAQLVATVNEDTVAAKVVATLAEHAGFVDSIADRVAARLHSGSAQHHTSTIPDDDLATQ